MIIVLFEALLLLCSCAFGNRAVVKVDQCSLCPKADRQKGIIFNGQPIRVPKILEEQELLIRLFSRNEKESFNDTISLALAGNLRAFTFLLKERDRNLLRLYGAHYQNRNGSRCVDPQIEKKIIEKFEDPDLRECLLAFFIKNLYQSRELFEKLVATELFLKEIRLTTAMIRALVATRQRDIEKAVLQHARRYTVNVELKYWWMLLPIDKYYQDFFIQRNYTPAVSFMQDILDETYYSKVPGIIRTHVYNRHRALYYQLDRFPSSLVEGVFSKQLLKLKNVPHDEIFFNLELEAAGRYALKHALSYKARHNIGQYLAGILESRQVYAQSGSERAQVVADYKMRSLAIDYLAQAGTRDAGTILIKELNRQANLTERKGSLALIARILNKLSALPAVVEIDVPLFMKAVKKLNERSQLMIVPEILRKHPHREGHTFLVSRLKDIVSAGKGFKMKYGMDNRSAYKMIFDVLITFDAAEYLFSTRQQIDTLFEQGSLNEELYISSSKQLNALIGNESAVYTAFREKREAEAIEREKQRTLAEEKRYRQQFEELIAKNMSPEGIKKNIQALYQHGSKSKNGAMWLVMTGPDILPYAHEAIRCPDIDIRVKLKLVAILGATGDVRSIKPILDAARGEPDGIYKDVFLALSQMPMTKKAFEFAFAKLRGDSSVIVRRSALVYFAVHRDRRALSWAKNFALPHADKELRLAAMFLLARLGEPEAKDLILESLSGEEKRSNLETLLRALAEVTTPEQFISHTGNMHLDKQTKWYQTAKWITEFRNAKGPRKAVFADRLLNSDYYWDMREAARYLIKEEETGILGRYLLPDSRVEHPLVMEAMQHRASQTIYIEARKMGYRFEETPEGIRLVKE